MWVLILLLCHLLVYTDQIYASEEDHILQSAIDAKQYYDLDKVEDLFKDFIVTYQKKYDKEEYAKKFEIFKKNVEAINEMNRNSSTAAFSITKFTDVSADEIVNYTGRSHPSMRVNPFCPYIKYKPRGQIPPNLDYRTLGYVTPVRNQLSCKSCYAHATVGNLEGQYFKKHGTLISFSDQQIVDCDPINHGCNGGIEDSAITYIHDVGGIQSYVDYPYITSEGYCHFNDQRVVAKVSGCLQFNFIDEEHLAHALYQFGPLSVGIESTLTLLNYKNGILEKYNPSPSGINHAVLVVGYGIDNGIPYWLIKNSWGLEWGEKGFAKILRGKKLFAISESVVTGLVE